MVNNRILGLLGLATRAGKIVFGSEAVIETIHKNKAKLVILATNTSNKTKENIKYICEKKQVPIIEFETIENISSAIGKENKAVICVKDKNFADEIYKIYGGEIVGKN